MINPKDITIVFQGALPARRSAAGIALAANIARLRRLLPGAPILMGTWSGQSVPQGLRFDHLAFTNDPGPLPSPRHAQPQLENNINRQLAGTQAAFGQVGSRYILKLRLDCDFTSTAFLKHYDHYGVSDDGRQRIAVPGCFTLDPRMAEQLPYHVSDWFAFGPSEQMRQLWSAPLMSVDDATYYDQHAAAGHSTTPDRQHRARWASKQYPACHYAGLLGYPTPAFHNDNSAQVLQGHDRFVARELLILDLDQFGIVRRKYSRLAHSSLEYLNCLSFLDWYALNRHLDPRFSLHPALCRAADHRAELKQKMRATGSLADPFIVQVRQPLIKACVSRVLRAGICLPAGQAWSGDLQLT